MADYLLDTNHLSPLITLTHPLRQRVLPHMRAGHTFALTIPILTELLFGIALTPRAKENLNEWLRLKPGLLIFDLDQFDGEQAAELQTLLRRRGRQLATVDALIAAVALRYDLTLLTTDGDFAAIPQLKQENWLARPATYAL
jgi:tRNA(fMet)-specific endonuclease VapC